MKRLAIILLALAAVPVWADFQTGLQAYEKGDFVTAFKEWQPLAEKGDANAQYNLAMLYAQGKGIAQDYKQAADWYKKAAEQGVAAAQYNLGVMYANGQGVSKDPAEGSKWFLKAAEKGVTQAETGLGRIYDEGEGAFRNYSEAEKWYRKAAERGVASAQYNLGVMYDIGQGVQRDYVEAMKWYRKAADQGYASACANIGILYYNAQGVKRDLVEAYAWFARAAKGGDPMAGQFVRIAASRMKPGDIQKGQQLAADWNPQKPAADADRLNTDALFVKPAAAPASPAGAPAAVTPAAAVVTPAPGAPAEAAAAKPAAAPAAVAPVRDVWTGVERVVAVGDVHGDFEQFVTVLESANLIDGSGNWIGGKSHLVQTGDIVDRGPDSRKVMDLLMRLEKQAAAAGGGVHVLIGNHEAMNIYGDLRYVSPGEFAAFRGDGSGTGEQSFSYTEAMAALAKPETDASRWNTERPLGFAEHRAAFGPAGRYGAWIEGHNAAIKIDGTLFVHAGISPKYAGWSLDRINEEVRKELRDPAQLHGGIVTDPDGPLWYKGLAQGDETALAPLVDGILKNFGVDRIVIGHSYANAAITPRFGGKVILIDIGLSRVYDNVGKVGCLVIEGGHAYALHRGQGLQLPKDEGPDMLRYLKQAAALDPKPSPLAARISDLEKK